MADVVEAVAAVKRDLICELPKMRRTVGWMWAIYRCL